MQGGLVLQQLNGLQLDHLRSHGHALKVCQSNVTVAGESLVRLQMKPLENSVHSQGVVTGIPANVFDAEWVVESPKGQYPQGSKALNGHDRSYIIAPLGSIVDEKYTAYFDFESPTS